MFENRPGGGNVIGTQFAARSAPDGYTFFFASAAALVTDPYTFKSLPYDPMKDFTVISHIAQVSFMVLAHPSVPAKNLPELFAYAKANPDKLQIATDGARRFSGMIAAWLNKLAGTSISYVPYTQMTQGIQDAIAGRVQLIIIALPTARGHIASGSLRPLAVTSATRNKDFPDVPAVAETFPGFDFAGWWVLAAPTGVPAPVIERVNREMNAVLADPAVTSRLQNVGLHHARRRHAGGGARLHQCPAQGVGHAREGNRAATGIGRSVEAHHTSAHSRLSWNPGAPIRAC